MRAPEFWATDGVLPRLLAPFGAVYAAATARRVARPGWRAPVPVFCAGNATAGGAGKTTLALDLAQRLKARGLAVAFLTRGYGGRARAPMRVDPEQDAAVVGDEPLLLAALAPTFLAADRATAARMAVAEGAQALVMDDGLQNPTLAKDVSFLVVDGEAGFGNGRIVPAGPLREPMATAAARCRAAVLIGADRHGIARDLPTGLPVLRASLQPGPQAAALAGRNVLAFAGIGRPEKFFAMLESAGIIVTARRGFADHHRYTADELRAVLDASMRLGAIAVTTPKDAARLGPAERARVVVVGVRLVWDDARAIEALLDEATVVHG
jgi:tetraacyldisaccharide 4'-kinase